MAIVVTIALGVEFTLPPFCKVFLIQPCVIKFVYSTMCDKFAYSTMYDKFVYSTMCDKCCKVTHTKLVGFSGLCL